MKKIVLLNPPFSRHPVAQTPLSVMAAAALLDQDGFVAEIVNGSIEPEYVKQVLEKCRGAICLGISSMTGYQIRAGITTSLAVREMFPSLPIVWGGWHASILPQETARDTAVDIVVRGQGERTFTELVQVMQSSNREFSGIKGIAFKNQQHVTVNEERAFEDINRFPPMPYHLVDVERILINRSKMSGVGRVLDYTSSHGCPNACRFCAEPLVMKRRWSGLSAERVVDEWAFLTRKYDLSTINLVDSNFSVNRQRVETICLEIIRRQLSIAWQNVNSSVNVLATYDKEMWQLLAKSGCRSMLVGAESGEQEMLDLLNKRCTVDDILKIANLSQQFSIKTSFSFMTGLPPIAGMDGIRREFKATMRIIHQILRVNKRYDIKLFLYTPYPGSSLYFESLNYGLHVPQSLSEWSKFELVNITTPWISNHFKQQVDQARAFAIPYFQREYLPGIGVKWSVFTFLRRLLSGLAGLRLRYAFFAFPLEYYWLRRRWNRMGLISEQGKR